MYRPPLFTEDRLDRLHAVMSSTGLATLVTLGAEGLEANHLPLVLDPAAGPHGTLYGHVARGNPLWRHGGDVLALFQGPDAYVSPSWYPSKATTGKAVPTWNYVAVHAHGRLEVIEEPERLKSLLARLTTRHEAARPHPWAITDAPADYLAAQMAGIVGFALPIQRLEGKAKLSQNRTPEDRAGVIAGLRDSGEPAALAMAEAMTGRD